MKTNTKANAAKLIKRLNAGYPLRDNDGVMTGIEIEDGKDKKMISDWKHELLAVFENVLFWTPKESDPHLKFVETRLTLNRKGDILEIPEHWTRGKYVGKERVTVTYRMANGTSAKALPLGVKAVGRAEISKRNNSRTGEANIIVSYYFYLSPTTTSHEVKFGGKIRDNSVFFTPIPDTTEFVVINKIGK